jgi:hypothetical protein
MSRPKGTAKTGGRQKGARNKLTADLKEMILGALDAKGGQSYLETQADEKPVAFMTLIGKVLPLTLQGNPDNPISLTVVTGVPRADDDTLAAAEH